MSRDNPYADPPLELRIDYIFIGRHRPNGAGCVEECQVVANESVDGVYPSDHYGVFATFSRGSSWRERIKSAIPFVSTHLTYPPHDGYVREQQAKAIGLNGDWTLVATATLPATPSRCGSPTIFIINCGGKNTGWPIRSSSCWAPREWTSATAFPFDCN